MDTLTYFFLAALAVIVIAILVTRAIVKSRIEARTGAEKAQLETEKARLETEITHLQAESARLTEEARKLSEDIPVRIEKAVEAANKSKDEVLEAREKAHEESMNTLRENFATALGQLKAQVKEDTDDLLKARQKEFKDASGEAIGTLLTPLKDKLEDLRKEMSANSDVHKASREAMKTEVDNLMKYTGRVSESTDRLAAAFKYGNKLQGTWGETILEELLSSQGLTAGVHFDVQPTITDSAGRTVKNEDGSVMRPDVIIHLDRRREVIIDAKTSLTAYVDYVNAANEEDKARYLKAHLDSLKSHVKELAKKDYSAYIQKPKVSAGYVIMFVPNMGALWAALNAEPDLWRRAAEQNVYIADEQTLYAAIRIVQLTWTQVQQAENHEKVFALADEMVDRVEKFLGSYEAVGKALESAAKAYTEGHRKLEPKGQSILTTARKLTEMGAKKGKVLEKAMLDIDDIEDVAALPEDTTQAE